MGVKTEERETTTIAVSPDVRNVAKAAAALEGKGIRVWLEDLIRKTTQDRKLK